jgi:uncharacterized membrane protein HdeD (DUF308 family)
MGDRIRKLFRGPIVSSILYIALGLLLALLPVQSVNLICKVVFGALMVAAGVYHVLIHLLESRNATILDLFSGVILIVFGYYIFMNPLLVVKMLPVMLGALILVDSLWTLRGAFRLKKRKRGTWKALLLGSLVFIALGVTLIINPFTVVKYTIIFAGCILVCNGVLDLLFYGLICYGIKKAEEEAKALEVEAVEVPEEEPKPEEDLQTAPVYEDWNSHVASMDARTEDSVKQDSDQEHGPDQKLEMEPAPVERDMPVDLEKASVNREMTAETMEILDNASVDAEILKTDAEFGAQDLSFEAEMTEESGEEALEEQFDELELQEENPDE